MPAGARRLSFRLLVVAALGLVLVAGGAEAAPGGDAIVLEPRVVRSFPHDPSAFTQGLVLAGGRLYESTGLYGRSSVREVHRASGRVVRERRLPRTLFGEGLAAVGQRLVQLTWKEGVAPVWQRASLRRVGTFSFRGEGWGLCYDGRRLVQSSGSARLVFRDPASFRPTGGVTVTVSGDAAEDAGLPPGKVTGLNELECVGESVYANVYLTNLIVEIDPANGRVRAVIDAASLRRPSGAGVLNGIAFDQRRGTFLLTGKLWPRLYEARFQP